MSRIGKMPIPLSDKLDVKLEGNTVEVKGPLGMLSFNFADTIKINKTDSELIVEPLNETAETKALWGTTRSVISNMFDGVTEGFKKSLEVNGVGYKFEISGKKLILSIGFSHKVEMPFPEGVEVKMDEKAKNIIHVSGIDKHLVGEFAAKIRSKKKPEPYKGKGIKYVGEHIRRKAGKSGK